MPESYETVVILGIPKSGTTAVARFFDRSDNFEVIRRRSNQHIECGNDIYEETDFTSKFAKLPALLFQKAALTTLLNFFEARKERVLFCVCIREFNEHLFSYYKQRLKEHPDRYGSLSYEEFKISIAVETLGSKIDPGRTYLDNILGLKANLLYLIEYIKRVDNFGLVIIDMKTLSHSRLEQIFRQNGVHVDIPDYRFAVHESSTNIEYDKDLHTAYLQLFGDLDIRESIYPMNLQFRQKREI